MATEPQKPDLTEVASTNNGRDITRGFIEALPYIPPTDKVLLKTIGYEAYEELLRDDQVAACFAQRRNAVISRPWSVTAGGTKRLDKQAAELVEQTLNNLPWDNITDQMLYARFFGFAVAEINWLPKDKLCIDSIKPKDRRRFAFGPDFRLKLLTSTRPNGEDVPERKFWVASVGASHADEPYGIGLGQALWWPVFFKRQGAKFWAIYLEKFGAPTAKGTFPNGTSSAERTMLLQTLQAISTDAGIIVPEGVEIELLEASRGGNGSYESWMAYWDAAIAKVILGQTMTTEDGSSYSQASVHYDVRQDLVAADADLVCQSANESWVRWLVDYNYPGAAYPSIWRDMEDSEDLKQRSERDRTLFDMGYKLTPKAVTRIYGDDYELIQSPPEPQAPSKQPENQPENQPADTLKKPIGFSTDLAENDELDPVAPMTERLHQETQSAWQKVIRHIEGLVKDATDLPSLRDQLLSAYADLPMNELTDVMGLAFAVAELAGRFEVANDN